MEMIDCECVFSRFSCLCRIKKKYHVFKFNSNGIDMTAWNKTEIVRDTSSLPAAPPPRPDAGTGSEFGKEARELARKRRLGFLPRQKRPDDLPWLVTAKANEKEKNAKDRQ